MSRYDTEQSDGDVPGLMELWGMQSIPLLPLLPGPLWPGVVAPDGILSMGETELYYGFESLLFLHFNCELMLN